MIFLLVFVLILANVFMIILSYKKLISLKIGVVFSEYDKERIMDSSTALFLAFVWIITWTVLWMSQLADSIVNPKDEK